MGVQLGKARAGSSKLHVRLLKKNNHTIQVLFYHNKHKTHYGYYLAAEYEDDEDVHKQWI